MKTKSIFLMMLVALLTLAACTGDRRDEVRLDGADGGSEVALPGDHLLALQLESNPTTGYGWEVAECDEGVLKLQGEPEYIPFDNSGKQVGSGGVQVFHFAPVKAGKTHLKLVYRRPWEKDAEPVEIYEIDVSVQ